MKRILISLICLAVALGASAKFRWGPTVGADFSYYYWHQRLISSHTLAGVKAGVGCEVMIPGIGFGVDFGLKYAYRGGRAGFGEQYIWSSDGIGNQDLRLHTVEVPVNLRFKWTRMDGFERYLAPFVYGGPQVNFNVANSKCEAIDRAGVSLGLAVGAGVELWRRFQISGGYVWDVTYDVETRKLEDFSARLEGWTLDFTVLF